MSRLGKNEICLLLSLRLIPVPPFFAVNVLAATSQVRFRNFVLKTGISILPGAIVFTSPCVGLESLFGKGVEMNLFLLWSPHLLLPFLGPLGLSLIPIFLNNKDEAE